MAGYFALRREKAFTKGYCLGINGNAIDVCKNMTLMPNVNAYDISTIIISL
jgi:hypothetical protein